MKIFFSYCFDDERLVNRFHYHLNTQPGLDCYCYSSDQSLGDWRQKIGTTIAAYERILIFIGARIGDTQEDELTAFEHKYNGQRAAEHAAVIYLPNRAQLPPKHFQVLSAKSYYLNQPYSPNGEVNEREIINLTREITYALKGNVWIPPDGLPVGYPFSYEKDIIESYFEGNGSLKDPKMLRLGCPEKWPEIKKVRHIDGNYNNPFDEDEFGTFRPDTSDIIVDTRSIYHFSCDGSKSCLMSQKLTLKEAGPRQKLVWPQRNRDHLNVGILVSGGIAPGINAVIDGIIERHYKYAEENERKKTRSNYRLNIYGYRDGFSGISHGTTSIKLTRDSIRDQRNQGGCIIGTSRFERMLNYEDPEARKSAIEEILEKLRSDHIDILYIIGGDGSMRAAHALWSRMQSLGNAREISIVAIPKTMDNDVLWVWQTFGFLSAVEKAKEFVRHLITEAKSNPRLCIVQLFGSDSGYVVSHAALASGECSAALIPEADFSMKSLSEYICKELTSKRLNPAQSPYGIIIAAETAIPWDVSEYLEEAEVGLSDKEKTAIDKFLANGRRVQGQTPDELRSGGLKILSRVLGNEIMNIEGDEYWSKYRVFTNEPRHLLRAIDPSAQDIIIAQRLGILAVDNAMAGYTDFMVSQWVTEYVLVPLELVVLGRKRVPQDGIFWKSVIARTGYKGDPDPQRRAGSGLAGD